MVKASFVYLFILSLLCLTDLRAQQMPTNEKIYDFEVGDEFHIEEVHEDLDGGVINKTFWLIERGKVIEKTIDSSTQTIEYKFSVNGYKRLQSSPNVPPYIETLFHEIDIVKINAINDTLFYPIPDSQICTKGVGDSLFYNSQMNNRITYTAYCGSFTTGFGISFHEGLGGWFGSKWMNPITEFRTLLYYKKGNETWGNPTYVGFDKEIGKKTNIIFFPNPTNGDFSIEFQQPSNGRITVLNLTGEEVFSDAFNSEKITHKQYSIKLPSGVYIVNIATQQGNFTEKLIIR